MDTERVSAQRVSGRPASIALTGQGTALLCRWATALAVAFLMNCCKDDAPEHERQWRTFAEARGKPGRHGWVMRAGVQPGSVLRWHLGGVRNLLETTLEEGRILVQLQTTSEPAHVLATEELPDPGRRSAECRLNFIVDETQLSVYADSRRVICLAIPPDTWLSSYWEAAGQDPQHVPEVRFRRIGTPLFSDDFMHDDGSFGQWEVQSGSWQSLAPRSALRSVNGFALHGRGKDAVIASGNAYWRDYSTSAALMPLGNSRCGLAVYRSGNGNCYEVYWSGAPGRDSEGEIVLCRVRNGRRDILDRTAQYVTAGRWIELKVDVLGDELSVMRDGVEVLRAVDDDPIPWGAVGLLAGGTSGCLFDDVRVRHTAAWRMSTAREGRNAHVGAVRTENTSGGTRHQITLGGSSIRVSIEPSPLDAAGETVVFARRRGTRDGIECRLRPTEKTVSARLLCRIAGRTTLLADTSLNRRGTGDSLTFSVEDGYVWLSEGATLLLHCGGAPPLSGGGSGVVLPHSVGERGFDITVCEPRAMKEITWQDDVLEGEEAMRGWNSAEGEWALEEGGGGTWWHRCDLYRNFALSVRSGQFTSEAQAVVIAGAEDYPGTAAAIRLEFRPGGQWMITSPVPDSDGIRRCLVNAADPTAVRVERRLDHLVVFGAGGQSVLFRLPESLRGFCRIGVEAEDDPAAWASGLSIAAENVLTYDFREAPVDWDSSSGSWRVTNRWQCDPRWCFMAGSSSRGTACTWNKHFFGNEVTLEFCVAPRMTTSAEADYSNAADLNASLLARPPGVPSGVSVLFGGRDNSGTYLLSDSAVAVHRPEPKIPRSHETHRRWFYVKLRSVKGRVSCWVDNCPVVTDLPCSTEAGRRIALWTRRNGMVVGRVRISADEIAISPQSTRPIVADRAHAPGGSPP